MNLWNHNRAVTTGGNSMLAEAQRKRIDDALGALTRDEIARRVSELKSPIELHQFALNYNVNDGFGPLWVMIRNPICDLGTAVYTYWQFANYLLPPVEVPPQEAQDQEWNAKGLIQEIEDRVQRGYYKHQTIAFDPRTFLDWTGIREYELQQMKKAGTVTFPEAMLNPTPGEVMEREWF